MSNDINLDPKDDFLPKIVNGKKAGKTSKANYLATNVDATQEDHIVDDVHYDAGTSIDCIGKV